MLAKIAHATAVGNLGLNAFIPLLPPYILGQDNCLSYIVGGYEADEAPLQVLHETVYEVWPATGAFLVLVKIRLFSQFGGPYVQVLVGTSTKEMLENRQPFALDS